MEFKDPDVPDYFDLTAKKESKKEKKERYKTEQKQFAQDVVSSFGDRLKFIKCIPKGVPTRHLTIRVPVSFMDMAEVICDKSKFYHTVSEVLRSALSIGLPIVSESEGINDPVTRMHYIMEDIYYGLIQIDEFLGLAEKAYLAFKRGVISANELRTSIDKLISELPKELHEVCDLKSKQLIDGQNIYDLFETRKKPGVYGGTR